MAHRKPSRVIGKGLKALIKEREERNKPLGRGKNTETKEFYGSLLKKYIRTGKKDSFIEQMLVETREHLGITMEEHVKLMKTLKKREDGHPTPMGEGELPDEVQAEIKGELKQLFKEFKNEIESGYKGGDKRAIPLPERSIKIVGKTEEGRDSKDDEKIVETIHLPKSMVNVLEDEGRDVIPVPPPREEIPEAVPVETVQEELPLEPPPEYKEIGGIPEMEEMPDPLKVEPDTGRGVDEEKEESASEEGREGVPEPDVAVPQDMNEGEGEELEEIGPDEIEPPHEHDSLLSLKSLMEEDRIEEALSMSERLLNVDPDNIQVLNERGVLLYHANDLEAALQCYRKALEMNPESLESLINYAVILAGSGEIDEAMAILDKALEKDPYYEEAWHNKAVVLTHAGRYREAIHCLDQALRIDDRSMETWLNKAIILEKLGDFGPACDAYRKALEIDPTNEVAKQGHLDCQRLTDT